jgi:hypothetical protein
MNPDLLADSRADFCFDSFDETHANPPDTGNPTSLRIRSPMPFM